LKMLSFSFRLLLLKRLVSYRLFLSAFKDVRTQSEPDPAKRQYNAEAYPTMWFQWLEIQVGSQTAT